MKLFICIALLAWPNVGHSQDVTSASSGTLRWLDKISGIT